MVSTDESISVIFSTFLSLNSSPIFLGGRVDNNFVHKYPHKKNSPQIKVKVVQLCPCLENSTFFCSKKIQWLSNLTRRFLNFNQLGEHWSK